MKLSWPLLIGIALGIVLILRAGPVLPATSAREHLKNGALLVDVRTAGEFDAKHVTNAVNIPLDQLKTQLPIQVPDKSRVLLLYCRSGRRSGIAEQQLRAMGYTNACNIGSYQAAEKAVASPSP